MNLDRQELTQPTAASDRATAGSAPTSGRRGVWVKAGLAILAAIAILGGYAAAREHFGPSSAERVFLLFHTLAELFSIVVACGIFVIAWNCRKIFLLDLPGKVDLETKDRPIHDLAKSKKDNNYLLFLGISWLFAAALDVAHLLAYRGMNIFAGYGVDLPTQLWISMRYMQAVSLLLAPLFLRRNLPVGKMVAAYAVVTAALLAACFTDVFPDCFIESPDASHSGHLTVFKIASEYVVAAIMLGALLLLARRREQFNPQVLRRLEGAILALIGAGMAFTLYTRSDDLMNLAGHVLQLGAFVLIYKAIIVTGLARPLELLFHNLKLSEESLNKVRQSLELRVQERTADLEHAVDTLQAEVEARIAVEAERRRLEAEVLKTSEMERQSIGYDLHDGLGQSLTGTAFLSAMLHRKLAARSLPEAADAAEIERLIMQAVQVARSLARGLSPIGLAGENLCKGLDDLSATVEEMYGIACVFKPGANVAALDRPVATHLYRIAQEAANNACKHGKARHIEIRLSSDAAATRLCVEDDGAGVPEKMDGQKGMGLRIMNYRANTIGATLEVRRRSQGGTAVQCVLPLPAVMASKLETGNGQS